MPTEPIKYINAVAYLDAAKGKARSQIIRGEDGKHYYVKFQQNPQGPKILVNELVSTYVARFLGVPSPEGAIIQISKEFIDINPALQKKFGEPLILPGWHFGSEEIKSLYPSPLPPTIFSKISNKNDIPAIIVFDALMCNTDRNNDGNYLISTHAASGKTYLHVIDHGHCLGGPHWNDALLNDPIDGGVINPVREMANLVNGVDPFRGPLNKLNELSISYLEIIVSAVPVEWGLTKEEKDAIVEFIMERKKHVGKVLQEHQHLFPFWRAKQ